MSKELLVAIRRALLIVLDAIEEELGVTPRNKDLRKVL